MWCEARLGVCAGWRRSNSGEVHLKGTFFFVHGTGVREPTTTNFWSLIQQRAKANGFDGVTFVNCRWGDEKGADLTKISASLPVSATTRAIDGEPTEEERILALWSALMT